MNETSFEGNIEQAAAGDVINKGPRFNNSNVVNLHVKGQSDEPQLSGDCLTFQQKRVISRLVKEITQITGAGSLDVWNQVLARAGSKKVKFIPKEYYVDLEEYLNGWLAGAKKSAVKINQPSTAAASAPAYKPPPERQHAISCPHCDTTKKALQQSRKITAAMLVFACSMTAVSIYLGIKTYMLNRSLQAAQAVTSGCSFEGKIYPLGSVLKNNKCAGDPPAWNAETGTADRKALPAKSRIHRHKSPELEENPANASDATEEH